MEYGMVSKNDDAELIRAVNELMCDGWHPLGGVSVVCRDGTVWWYHQAVVRNDAGAKSSAVVTLKERKNTLIKHLARNGPSTRIEIVNGTDIPFGSLSSLLSDRDVFESDGRGVWKLRSDYSQEVT